MLNPVKVLRAIVSGVAGAAKVAGRALDKVDDLALQNSQAVRGAALPGSVKISQGVVRTIAQAVVPYAITSGERMFEVFAGNADEVRRGVGDALRHLIRPQGGFLRSTYSGTPDFSGAHVPPSGGGDHGASQAIIDNQMRQVQLPKAPPPVQNG